MRACCSTRKSITSRSTAAESSCACATGRGHETLDGAFVIAADGSRSDVRAALGIDFDGSDYPDKILRVMTDDDLDVLLPGIAPVTYLWNGPRSVSFLRMPDCWRIILRVPKEIDDRTALDPAWILSRLHDTMPQCTRLPNVLMSDIYGVSKRVASRFREGRIAARRRQRARHQHARRR
jgi:2-polyprenyl-6-methoxyphenol hydroxylase-like FAD-dependent oxidoreductase